LNLLSEIVKNLQINELKKVVITFFLLFVTFFLDFVSIGMFFPLIASIIKDNANFLDNFFILSYLSYFPKKEVIYILLILIAAIFLLKNVIALLFSFFKKKLLAEIQVEFTSRVFNSYINSEYEFFSKRSNSELIRNCVLINEYIIILENFLNIFIEFTILFFIFFFILYTNYKVGLFLIFISILLYFLFSKSLSPRLEKYGAKRNIYDEKILQGYLNTFGSIKDLIIQKKQDFFLKKFSENIYQNSILNVKSSFLMEFPRYLIEVVMIFLISIIIFIYISNVESYEDLLIQISFFITLVFRAMPSVSRIIYQGSSIRSKVDLVKRVNNLFVNFRSNNIKKIENKFFLKNKFNFESLKFENVFFRYDNKSEYILENINFELSKNSTIGIIGESGAGKSTLIDLISGLLKPSFGKILINKKNDFKNNFIKILQKRLSYMSQKNFLLNDTIKNNVAFGVEENDINYDKLDKALSFAKIDNLFKNKDKVYKYQVGEDGKNLSGGQRQRVVLARSIYRDAEIYLFDEISSSLDSLTEKRIFNDIKEKLHKNKTIIICSHNIKLIYFCDQIFKINKKKLIKVK
jgi:ABC-type multidrug transport system fused ATPase/permease subunit